MKHFQTRFRAMATEHDLQVHDDDPARARRAADAAVADVLRIEAKYSRYRDDSVTTRINRAAGAAAVAIDAETAALLRYADRCHALSGGRFDITSGVLRRAWDFRREPPALPEPAALAAAVACIDWPAVEWSDSSVRLPRAGMEIDFGGVGKEYAADRAATILAEHGVRHALVNLGGDLRAIGPQADGRALAGGHPASAPRGRDHRRHRPGRRRARHQRRLRALFRARRPPLLPHPRPRQRHAGDALAVGVGARAAVRAGGQLRDHRHAARRRGAGFLAAQGVQWFGVRADGTLAGPADRHASAG